MLAFVFHVKIIEILIMSTIFILFLARWLGTKTKNSRESLNSNDPSYALFSAGSISWKKISLSLRELSHAKREARIFLGAIFTPFDR